MGRRYLGSKLTHPRSWSRTKPVPIRTASAGAAMCHAQLPSVFHRSAKPPAVRGRRGAFCVLSPRSIPLFCAVIRCWWRKRGSPTMSQPELVGRNAATIPESMFGVSPPKGATAPWSRQLLCPADPRGEWPAAEHRRSGTRNDQPTRRSHPSAYAPSMRRRSRLNAR